METCMLGGFVDVNSNGWKGRGARGRGGVISLYVFSNTPCPISADLVKRPQHCYYREYESVQCVPYQKQSHGNAPSGSHRSFPNSGLHEDIVVSGVIDGVYPGPLQAPTTLTAFRH